MFEPTAVSDDQPVATVCQGAIFFVRGSLASHWDAVREAFELSLPELWARQCDFFRFSDEFEWQRMDTAGLERVRWELEEAHTREEVWGMRWLNRTLLADCGFEFRDLRPGRGDGTTERASYVAIRLPLNTDPDVLRSMVRSVVPALPLWWATAGFTFVIDPPARALAYDQIWAWARRYWGIGIQDAGVGSWDAPRGLWEPAWLTVLSHDFVAERLPEADWSALPPSGRVEQTGAATLLQLGTSPRLLDWNRFEPMDEYVTMSKFLEPAFVEDPTALPGMFSDLECTGAWIRRFCAPRAWLEPEL